MATVSNEVCELACTYAALILHDDKVPITAEKINTILKAAGLNIPPFWASLYGKVLASRNLDDLILNAGGGGAPAPSTAPSTAPTKEPPKEDKGGKDKGKKKEEPKEEPKEEEEEMGFGLFDE